MFSYFSTHPHIPLLILVDLHLPHPSPNTVRHLRHPVTQLLPSQPQLKPNPALCCS